MRCAAEMPELGFGKDTERDEDVNLPHGSL